MPEGDTVYQTAARLRVLEGQTLRHTDFRVPALASADLTGGTVARVRSRGKHLLIDVTGEPPVAIHSHLLMEGAWDIHPTGQRWRRPGHSARVILATEHYEAVGFSLGILELLTDPAEVGTAPGSVGAVLAHLGPDLLGDDWDADEAVRRLATQSSVAVGLALLDQRLLAGIGNVYRSEVCFLRGIAPTRPIGDVDVRALVDLAHRLLWANRLRPARTTTGDTRRNARLWVYGRGGQSCRRCATPINRGELGPPGRERVVYWCPRCQR
ncbi:MAG: DNA-formamidopyrimidine glycosylase family protein [Gordonia sp. (in: high G+C Gram-positive bacteria)]